MPNEFPSAAWSCAMEEHPGYGQTELLLHTRDEGDVATGLPQQTGNQLDCAWTNENLHFSAVGQLQCLAAVPLDAAAVVTPEQYVVKP